MIIFVCNIIFVYVNKHFGKFIYQASLQKKCKIYIYIYIYILLNVINHSKKLMNVSHVYSGYFKLVRHHGALYIFWSFGIIEFI